MSSEFLHENKAEEETPLTDATTTTTADATTTAISTTTSSSGVADDKRATIAGEASLVGPPLIRKLELFSVNTTPTTAHQRQAAAATPTSSRLNEPPEEPTSRPLRSSSTSPNSTSPVPMMATSSSVASVAATGSLSSRGLHTPDGTSRKSSPAMMMMGVSAGNSPSTSQVSVGSVGPTLAAALLPRHCALTPVTSNTKELYAPPDRTHTNTTNHRSTLHNATVSPEEQRQQQQQEEDFLHGEHLALPSEFTGAAAVWNTNPSLLTEHLLFQHNCTAPAPPAEPVQFPARKSYTFTSREEYEEEILQYQQLMQQQELLHHHNSYSATTATTTATTSATSLPVLFPPHHYSSLTPYQPSREDDLQNIGQLPHEAVSQIFMVRRDDESHANHRLSEQQLLQHAPPPQPPSLQPHSSLPHSSPQHSLQQQQQQHQVLYPVPSLHLANPLHGSNTLSFTDHTDNTEDCDEESLLYVRCTGGGGGGAGDDDASLDVSLTSHTSSLYLPDETTGAMKQRPENAAAAVPMLSLSSRKGTTVVMEELGRVMADARQQQQPYSDNTQNNEDEEDDAGSLEAVVGAAAFVAPPLEKQQNRRKRKQRKREELAMDWLQSVGADQNVLAEAASSKFLTGKSPEAINHVERQLQRRHTLISSSVMGGPAIRAVVSADAQITTPKSRVTPQMPD